jgi:broad specificity phosphatase PhoE
MFDRARPFVEEILAHPAQNIAIVSHGMIGKVMVAIVLRLTEEETLEIHQPNDVVLATEVTESIRTPFHFVAGQGPYPGLFVRETPGRSQTA